ncbi:MAG: alpha/beta hydrolase, partial [Chloroflexi bacterium]
MLRRHLRVWLLIAVVVVLGGAYLYVGTRIYDELSVVHAGCDGRWQGQTPANFSVGGVDMTGLRMPGYEDVRIPSRDPGVTLSSWFVPSAVANAPAVVVVHGMNSCKREARILLAAGLLHRHGFSVLLMDMRNHGDSTVQNGHYAGGTKEYRDVLGAWDWLVSTSGLSPHHVGLMGFSLGAATVLIATGEEQRVAATWEDSSYAEVGETIRAELARKGYPTWLEYAGYTAARI